MATKNDFLYHFFNTAVSSVLNSKYSHEVDWQRSNSLHTITEQDFLRETAWVIINSGFKEKTARNLFGYIELAFQNFACADLVLSGADLSLEIATGVLNHPGKIKGIIAAAELVKHNGFKNLRERIEDSPLETLQLIPYIGKTTARHLAKNLGLNIAKPDRHMIRLAEAANFESVDSMCRHLSQKFNEQVKVIDLILWRFMAELPNSIDIISNEYKFPSLPIHQSMPIAAVCDRKLSGAAN